LLGSGVAIRYEIEEGVLVLQLALEGFARLRDALETAVADPAAGTKMPLLLDVRSDVPGVRYEDIRWRVEVLSQMREQLGRRCAILTATGPLRVGVGRMFSVLSRIEGLEVRTFAEKQAALAWLKHRAES
jgi:hypothetical protein